MHYPKDKMRIIPLKTVVYAVFFSWTAMVLGVCVMEPVNLTVFVSDSKVVEVIQKGQEKVILKSGSEGTAGNGIIIGLDSNKYYIIEEWHENNSFNKTYFISADGKISPYLDKIGKVTTVTGLTNHNTYNVRPATALPATSLSYTDSGGVGGSSSATVSNGEITITLPNLSGTYTLDISNYVTDYQIVQIPISPTGSNTIVSPSGNNITLLGKDTTTDYVFVKSYDENKEFSGTFYFLKVIIKGPQTVTVTIAYVHESGQTIEFDPATLTIAQATALTNTNYTITLTGANADDFSNIVWSYTIGSTPATANGPSLVIDFTDPANVALLRPGNHRISVSGTYTDGKIYSGEIMLVIE